MNNIIKPEWFTPIACVIIYRLKNGILEFLLGERKEDKKWALVGGTGAFWEGAKNPFDFARCEAVYDLDIAVDVENLRYFTERSECTRKRLGLEVFFSYRLETDKEIKVTANEKAPSDCQWFTLKQVREMAGRGKIAFDNNEILEEFSNNLP